MFVFNHCRQLRARLRSRVCSTRTSPAAAAATAPVRDFQIFRDFGSLITWIIFNSPDDIGVHGELVDRMRRRFGTPRRSSPIDAQLFEPGKMELPPTGSSISSAPTVRRRRSPAFDRRGSTLRLRTPAVFYRRRRRRSRRSCKRIHSGC
jgi:hypothetical protein